MTAVPVVAAVIRAGGRLFVQRRRDTGALDGTWEFPGGKLRPGETPDAALAREVQEETGCAIRVGPLLYETTHDYADRSVHLRVYAAELAGGSPPLPAGDAARLVTPAELAALPVPAANAPLVAWLAER